MSKRVAVYARYSSDLQKATSIEDQVAMAERLCAEKGWQIVDIFEDREMSGRSNRRPGFVALKQAAALGSFDVVVVEAIDRLTRKISDALNTFDLFSFQNVSLYSVTEGGQDFMRVLLAGFGAQMFSQMIAEHTRRGMKGAVTRKRLHTLPFGDQKLDSEDGPNRESNPEQATVVRRIFTEFASGKSSHRIALDLNLDRVPAPNGGSWDGSTIRGNKTRQEGILRNRLYIGTASICRTTHQYHPETGAKKVKLTPQETVEKDIPELRIIEQELWDAVQAELGRRAAATPKAARAAHRNKYLLSGLLTCGCCGGPYIIATRTGYRCRESMRKACNNTKSISRKRIEARVFGALRDAFMSPDLIDRFEQALEQERHNIESGAIDTKLAHLKATLHTAETAQSNILNAIAEGAPFATFKSKAETLEKEITDLTARIGSIQAQVDIKINHAESAAVIYERALNQMNHLLGDSDLVDEASSHLKMLIEKIVLTPDETAQHGLSASMILSSDALFGALEERHNEENQGGVRKEC